MMFEFLQNQQNNEELISVAQQIENLSENYIEHSIPIRIIKNILNSLFEGEERETEPDDNVLNWPQDADTRDDNVTIDRQERLPLQLGPDDYVTKDHYTHIERRILEVIAFGGDMLDHDLRNDNSFTEEYTHQVRKFFNGVSVVIANAESSNDDAKRKGYRVRELIPTWLKSITEFMQPLGTLSLLFIDYTVRQTRMLLELYQNGANMVEKTQRHMFEMGLKCLKISDISFLDILFTPNRIIDFSTRPFRKLFRKWVVHQVAVIHWITNAQIAKDIQEDLFDGFPFAESAYRKGHNSGYWETVLCPYEIHYKHYSANDIKGRFHFKDENLNGFLGYRDIDAVKKEIIIGFSGTEICSKKNWRTNVDQFIGRLPLPYAQACGIVDGVWKGSTHKKGFENAIIKIYGHSLGGGLMQYAIANSSAKRIYGYGYNSAGLSFKNIKQINSLNKPINIYHLYNPCDVVFILPGSIQLGVAVEFDQMTPEVVTAHLVRTIRRKIRRNRNRRMK